MKGGESVKKVLLVLLAFLFISTAAADSCYVLCQPDSFVNVREFPRMGAQVAGYAELGVSLETDWTRRNGFVKVYGFEAGEAWIYAGFVTEHPVTVETVNGRIESTGRVACRRYINGTRRQWLKNGTEVVIYARSEDWSITNKGFIKTQFLGVFSGE